MIILNKYIILIIVFFIHLLFIFFPSLNFEYVFSDAASQFNINKLLAINNYFQVQANTFVFPILIYVSNIVFSFDYLTMSRLISIVCVIPLGISIIKFSKIISLQYSNYLVLIILINPFVFVMAHRGSPDFISAALALIALPYLIEKKRKNILIFFFSIVLGLAISIKPTVGIVLILINIYYFIDNKLNLIKTIKESLYINILTLLPFLIYSLYINYYFNFYLTSDYYYNSLKISSVHNYISNFILYIGFSYLFILPFRLSFLFHKIKKDKFKYYYLILVILIIFVGLYFPIPQPELNLSFVSNIIGKKIENCIFFVSFSLLLFDLYIDKEKYSKNNPLFLSIFFTITIFFLIMSFFSPSQRYLICIMPLIIYFFFNSNKFNIITTLLIYLLFSFLLSINQYMNGKVSELIVDDLIKKNMISFSCPGVIEAHLGNKFLVNNKNCNSNKKYTVVYGNHENSVMTKNIKFIFFTKTLSVIKL